MEGEEVPQTLEYRGSQLNAAPILEVENFINWKKRFMCHIIGPFDVKESRVMDLKLCYSTLKFKEEAEIYVSLLEGLQGGKKLLYAKKNKAISLRKAAEVPQTLEYKGDQLNAAHVLEVENFTNWKNTFICHIIGIEPQCENIISNGHFVPMAVGQKKPEAQWTADE
nr:hypothetical protein [Tanacetum cinerariifolium]